MKKIFKHLFMTIHALLYFIYTSLISKKDNLWLFGAWKGTAYNDNSKYLFEYVCKEHPEIQAVWITKNKNVYTMLQSRGLPVELYPSKNAKRLIAHARFLFQTEGSRDIGRYPVGGATVLQLFHGIPVKKLKWYDDYSKIKRWIIRIESDDHRRSIWTSTSDFYVRAYGKLYGVSSDHFVNTGAPRCDAAVTSLHNEFVEQLKAKDGYAAVVLYLPTHRNFGQDFNNNFILDGLDFIDEYFSKKNICLLYKPHPNEMMLFKEPSKGYKNVVILDGNGTQFQDVYSYLYSCDCLISDYSSVIYDYLCVNRPIVLFDYDLENYKENDAGIFDDYFEHPIGPICMNWHEVAEQVTKLLDKDDWNDQRANALTYFNKYSDGNSCRKVTEYVLSCINYKEQKNNCKLIE